MVTPTFNPAVCLWGYYPIVAKPTIRQGSTGGAVGYLQGVLKCRSGQPLNPSANGPWSFTSSTKTAVRNFQAFWKAHGAEHLVVDGVVGPQTWPLIDWASQGFPT